MGMEEIYIRHNTPEWIELHKEGVSGSEAAAAIGMNPFKTNIALWEEKVGRRRVEDLSNNSRVKYGEEAEGHLFRLFALDYPQYECTECKDVVYKRDFMIASLDGELYDSRNGKYGFYEGKTTQLRSRADLSYWEGKVPRYYFAQMMHYFAVTGYEFAILKAQIKFPTNVGELEMITRHYRFDRNQYQREIENIYYAEREFWGYVQRNVCPPLKRRSILN